MQFHKVNITLYFPTHCSTREGVVVKLIHDIVNPFKDDLAHNDFIEGCRVLPNNTFKIKSEIWKYRFQSNLYLVGS